MITTMETCKSCGGSTLYAAFPSGLLYCSRCGNRADAEPARNIKPDPIDEDVRKRARKQHDALKADERRKARQEQKKPAQKPPAKRLEAARS